MTERDRAALYTNQPSKTLEVYGSNCSNNMHNQNEHSSIEDDCTKVLTQLHQSWQKDSLTSIRENFVQLAAVLSLSKSDQENTRRIYVQKGLFRILQKHYTSYKVDKGDAYSGFQQKFELLLELLPLTLASKSADGLGTKAFADDLDEEGVQILIHLLQGAIDRHIGLFSTVLRCLRQLTLSGESKANVLQIALSRLPHLDISSDLLTVVPLLGCFPSDDIESLHTVAVIRELWRNIEKQGKFQTFLLAIAREVVQWFSSEWNGHLLATAYIRSIEQSTGSSKDENSMQTLDLCVLLSLLDDSDFGNQCQQIIDSWIEITGYYDSIHRVMHCLESASKSEDTSWEVSYFCHELVDATVNLAIRHLRCCAKPSQTTVVHDYCLYLFENVLEESGRIPFVDAVVLLWHETLRKDQKFSSDALYSLLQDLSEKAPELLVCHRDAFVDAVESNSIEDQYTSHKICSIAARLFENDEADEILQIVDRFLFASVDCFKENRIENGLRFATEVMKHKSENQKLAEALKSRVLEIMLPSDRRVVPPQVGSPGLAFLGACPDSADTTFRLIQMILANTGLIQRYAAYSETKRKYVPILGYLPKDNAAAKENTTFIFCVAFFLREIDCQDITNWGSIVRWVFDLVDSYLGNGRKGCTSSWNPRGWLEAAVEFPGLVFPFDVRGSQQKKIAEWVLRELAAFDLGSLTSSPPPHNLKTVLTDVLVKNYEGMKLFQRSLKRFGIGLLIGAGLSAAVLKNAFAHFRATDDLGSDVLLKMIEGQITKLHHLRDKILAFEQILGPIEAAHRKLGEGTKSPQSFIELKDVLGELVRELFYTPDFIDGEILWEMVSEKRGNDILKDYLRNMLSLGTPVEVQANDTEVGWALQSKLRMTSHLVSLNQYSICAKKDCIRSFASFTFFLVGLIHHLRDSLSDMDSPPLNSWLKLAATSVHLIKLSLVPGTKGPPDPASLIHILGPCLAPGDTKESVGLQQLIDGLQRVLKTSDEINVSNGLLEILSALCTIDRETLSCAVKSSSDSLHKMFPKSEATTSTSDLPYTLFVASKNFKAPSNALSSLRKALDSTVCRVTNNSRSRSYDAFAAHRYFLLRHFGLLMLQNSSADEMHAFLLELTETMEFFFNEKPQSAGKSISSPSRRKTKAVSSFPCLTESTFADFFETTMHMVIGALIMNPPAEFIPRGAEFVSPYHRFQELLCMSRRLTDIYVKNIARFPRKSTGAFYSSSRTLMDASETQLIRCADWRSSQRLPTAASDNDPGSLLFLAALVRTYHTTIAEGLGQVAEAWTNDKAPQVSSKGKALRQLVDRFAENVNELSSLNALPDEDTTSSSHEWVESKRRRVALSKETSQETSQEVEDIGIAVGEEDNDKDYVAEESELEDADDSFGAAGEWGDDTSMEEDSVTSVQAITIHRAT